jgi:hypothetical protein
VDIEVSDPDAWRLTNENVDADGRVAERECSDRFSTTVLAFT